MSVPPKEKRASESAKYNRRLQASLATRMNRVCSIAELMPRVLAITFAQGTARRADCGMEAI